MHRSHQSRGRILFEVLCALTISAALAGGWIQTGAWALLPGAAAAALYGLVHLFDMRRGKPAEAVQPQRIDFDAAIERDRPAHQSEATPSAEDQPPAADSGVGQPEADEPVAARSAGNRRSGGSRKGNGRRSGVRKEAKVAKSAAPVEVEAVSPAPPQAASIIELAPPPEEEFALTPEEEAAPAHIQPLFEPEPFARMPRPAFGRRGRL